MLEVRLDSVLGKDMLQGHGVIGQGENYFKMKEGRYKLGKEN